jgi:2-alkenal reductase
MSQQSKRYLLMGLGLVVMVVLLGTAALGGVAGYVLANRAVGPVEQFRPVSNVITESGPQVVAASQNNQAEAQPAPLVVDESDSVAAVEAVLPAVVTVLNRQGNFGGGSGSGVFISDTGYVVTNNHVVEGAGELSVVYAQGGTAPATLVGTSPEFDIAVIKVAGPVPAVAPWGDSSELPLGGQVIAIGSALGRYQNTVTAGILSGFNRELGGLQALLQTDAAINSGNSGGPLINLGGQIIGINTAVVRGGGSGAAEGLGFAIPSNVARNVARQLIESGQAKPAFLGIQYQPLNPQLVSEAGLSLSQGAILEQVVSGTPAAQAGLQAGDIIVAINGKPIDDRNPLVSLLLEHVAGESITLDVVRASQTLQTELVLGERA